MPTTGGADFRIYRYAISRATLRAAEAKGLPVVYFLHPRELDPGHPVVRFKPLAMATHDVNHDRTRPGIELLLTDIQFTTLAKVSTDAIG